MKAPSVVRLLAGTLLGRLPTGMAPLAILLLVQDDGGSLPHAGALCALYGLAAALGQPLLGRLVDRHGQTLITGSATALTTAVLLALPAALDAGQSAAANALVVLAGLATPPLEAGLRALWPHVLPDPEQRRAALAVDTGSQGLIYIAGPPLTVALAHAFNPAAALVAAALAGLVGAAVVLSSGPSRTWRPTGRRASLLGPLHHAGLRRLFIALNGTGFALGALTVWAVSAADRQHAPWLAGTVPAALSVGSVAAGALLAHRVLPGTPAAQLRCAAAVFSVSWLPLLADPSPWAAVAAVVVPGAVLTPLITSAFLTTESLTAPGMVTEAYAWLIAAVGTGQAAGTALAGLTTTHSAHTTAALPALGAAFTAAVLLTSRQHMNPTPHPTPSKENRLGRPNDLDC
ncbi:MFS transporter [Actinacidiphila rubida]|uniref:Predicted arabinose efflux permease, MFS family n=1 Tax=Actinacidiphila rubida TaxID=310780 RepID=A0A1H8S5J7_9ACTN|nr:MFS transporter [Actinacidiphila rubida]SEO73588.1 Predicted arabinose efflux permease, MFS family [Actinacidiphila rubida]